MIYRTGSPRPCKQLKSRKTLALDCQFDSEFAAPVALPPMKMVGWPGLLQRSGNIRDRVENVGIEPATGATV